MGRPKKGKELKYKNIDKFCIICKEKLTLKRNSDVEKKTTCSKKCQIESQRLSPIKHCEICDKKMNSGAGGTLCKQCWLNSRTKYDKVDYTKSDGSVVKIRTNNFCVTCNKPLTMDGQEKCRACSNEKLIDKVAKPCSQCSKSVTRYQCQLKTENIFCSVSCGSKHRAKKYREAGKRKLVLSRLIRDSSKYKETTQACFTRDGFRCQKCSSSQNLQSHHIKLFSTIFKEFLLSYPHLLPDNDKEELCILSENYEPFWDLFNITTLCISCHQVEHPNISLNKGKL